MSLLWDRVPKLLIHVPIPGELHAIWPMIGMGLALARAPRAIPGIIAVGLIVFAGLVAKKVAAKDYWAYEDPPSAVDYLRSKMALGEVLYVHAAVAEQTKLQLRISRWRNPPAVLGDTGHPCCPQRKQLGVTNKNGTYIRVDLAHHFSSDPPVRIWAIVDAKDLAARDEKRLNEAGEVLNAFREMGYQVNVETAFEGVRVLPLVRASAAVPGGGGTRVF